MKYDIVSENNLTDLVRQVNYLLSKGYVITGDVVVTSHKAASNERAELMYTQTLMFYGED